MAKPWEIDEGLWARIAALLPDHRPGARGPVPLDDRKCLQGVLFVLYTGINWKHLPPELGFGSGITCWRRFRRCCEAGVWDRLHRLLLSELYALGEIGWSAVCLDGSHVRAKKGGEGSGRSPVDRGRPGSKHHIACDSTGIPLAVITTAGDVPDIKAAPDLVEAIGHRPSPPVQTPRRPLGPISVHARGFHQTRREPHLLATPQPRPTLPELTGSVSSTG